MRAPLFVALVMLAACSGTQPPPKQDAGPVIVPDGGPTPFPCEGTSIARCEGECVELDADARHCGACGNACPENGVCDFGTCVCPANRMLCDDVCADLMVDSDHCGACGVKCAPGTACVQGACITQCPGGEYKCDGTCTNLKTDPDNCGACGKACGADQTCQGGQCKCSGELASCGAQCVDTATDLSHCGGCGQQCFAGFECVDGACGCPAGRTNCQTLCANISSDPFNCGGCGITCQMGQACVNGLCEAPCPTGWMRCNGLCVDSSTDTANCGACGNACGNLSCQAGQCGVCNSATTDCDNDGWLVAEGDCCDQPGVCGLQPSQINPGALELVDGVDNNCNGLLDGQDVQDTRPCDTGLPSNSSTPADYAKALGICRTTTLNAGGPAKTWGLISAQLLRADGTPITNPIGHSIRQSFGSSLSPQEGRSFVVISSGAAADAVQTNPGPNGGPGYTSIDQQSSVDIQGCTQPECIVDWFGASNPPLKQQNQLPEAPGCSGGGFGTNFANDSVMLVLTLRAPTNVRAFEFNGYFLSSEYPEYVCSTFNDQLVALVDTPGGTPIGAWNPADKNLMTYFDAGKQWPIGINVAHGTSIFRVCEDQTTNAGCWDSDVSAASCAHGAAELAGTGFEASGLSCTNGGGTGWLRTSGNLRPGELLTLRIAIWDAGDHILDSLAILDAFKWLKSPASPGTTD